MPLSIVTSPNDLALSKSSIVYKLQAIDDQSVPYSSNTIPDGYEVTIQVFFEKTYNSGTFEIVATTRIRPDSNGQVEIDLFRILDSEIQASFPGPPIPSFDENEPYILPTYKNYYITYKEDYVNFSGNPTQAPGKSVLYGGLYKEEDFFANASSSNSLVGDYSIPGGKRIGYDQPEFISWYNYTGSIRRVYVEATSQDEDGSNNTTLHYSSNTIDVQPGQVITFPVGPQILALPSTRVSYSVEVVEQTTDTRFSEARKYKIDRDYQRFTRYLMYLNIFGSPETLRCTGVPSEDLDIDRKIASVLQSNTTILRYAKQQYSVDFEQVFTFRTGYLEIEEIDALKDLLIHNQVYEVSTIGFTAILIDTDSFSYTKSDFLFSLQFVATPAASQTFASGLAAINWDLSNTGGGGSLQVDGHDQEFPNQQTADLIWTRNGGVLPANTRAFVFVFEETSYLFEGRDYTISHNSGPGESTINIPEFIQGSRYVVRAIYITTS